MYFSPRWRHVDLPDPGHDANLSDLYLDSTLRTTPQPLINIPVSFSIRFIHVFFPSGLVQKGGWDRDLFKVESTTPFKTKPYKSTYNSATQNSKKRACTYNSLQFPAEMNNNFHSFSHKLRLQGHIRHNNFSHNTTSNTITIVHDLETNAF